MFLLAYAQVMKMLGNGRLEAICLKDNQKRLCHIRGKLRKKVWINTTDVILIGLRDFQDDKADVILKYTPDEARQLKVRGEIPEHVNITDTSQFGQDTGGDDIYFDEQFDEEVSEPSLYEFAHTLVEYDPLSEVNMKISQFYFF